MAHEIEDDRAFFVNTKPWHPQGIVLDREPTTEWGVRCLMTDDPNNPDADCNVYDMPLYVRIENEDGTVEYIENPDYKSVIRADKSIVGTVGKDRETIQPVEQFQFFEPFRESGLVTLESGMSLRSGTQLVLTAKLKQGEFDVVPNDSIKSYLMFAISFDSSLAQTIKFTSTRVVCANTLAMAMNEENKNGTWKNRHTKNVRDRISLVQDTIGAALRIASNNQEAFQYLAKTKASFAEQKNYIHQVFDYEEKPETSTKAKNKIQAVIDLLDTQKGLDLVPAIKGTMWQAYNAVTEHLTHEAGHKFGSRLSSNLFGANATLNNKALSLALAH